MKQTYVGTFRLGHENVDLYALPDEGGGYFYSCPDAKSCARMKVGLDHRHWDQCLAVLMHETFELALVRTECRYEISEKLSGDAADFVFLLTHEQFTRACTKVAMFMSEAVPKLSTLWQRQHRRKRKRK